MSDTQKKAVAQQKFASPCIRNCCLDEHDVCLGCFRQLAEITQWSSMNDDQKKNVLLVCAERQAQKRV